MGRTMEVTAYILGGVVVIFALIIAVVLNNGHRDLGLWLTCGAICCAVLGVTCWYQDWLWKADEKDRAATTAESDRVTAKERAETRAYIQSWGGEITDLRQLGDGKVTVRAKNTGRTPAHNVTFRTTVKIRPPDYKGPFLEPQNPRTDAESVAFVGIGVAFHQVVNVPITDGVSALLKTGENVVWISGRVEYDDVFGDRQRTNYRYIWGGNAGFNTDALTLASDGNGAEQIGKAGAQTDSMRFEQRPWIGVLKITLTLPPVAGERVPCFLLVENAGHTPATMKKFMCIVWVVPVGGDMEQSRNAILAHYIPHERDTAIPARTTRLFEGASQKIMDAETVAAINAGQMTFLVVGRIEYTDPLGTECSTGFCQFYYHKSKGMLVHDSGNYMH
jgi:hypothetical protein